MGKIKEVLCMHHTHLDVGYTHVQPALIQMHLDYLDQVLELCAKTETWPEESRFRWTCETTLPVMKWLEVAEPESVARLQHFLTNGQICIAAQPFHATPLANAEQINQMLQPVKYLRDRFGIRLDTSINHDVNGQPWPMSQLLLDAGIKLHIMGINTHFGGFPLERRYLFRWRTPDNRELLAFNGEIYVLFNWMFKPELNDLDYLREKLEAYVAELENSGYPHDFVFLTATNPPMPDNNAPDHTLAEVIRRWNETGHEVKIRFATSEMLLDRVATVPREAIPVHGGDWTDYWNFGSGSSAKQTRLHRKARQGLAAADLLASLQGTLSPQYRDAAKRAWDQTNLYTEHTWGHAANADSPDRPDVDEAWNHKAHYAYDAAGLTTYLLGKQMEHLAGNPEQSGPPEGVLVFNPTPTAQTHSLYVPKAYWAEGRHLACKRLEFYTQSTDLEDRQAEATYVGEVDLAPFTWKKLPLAGLAAQEAKRSATVTDDSLENARYRLKFDSRTGRILELWDKARNWQLVDTASDWNFFQYVHESIDTLRNPDTRKTFYRDGAWNPDWQARRLGASRLLGCRAEFAPEGAQLILNWEAPGVRSLEQRITLYDHRPGLGFDVLFDKLDTRTPEGLYFAFPLALGTWKAKFDTAGVFVELDDEQLPGASRDWVTVDQTLSVYDGKHGVTLACPDAPLVQPGGFGFGKKRSSIPRNSPPLLLAWPMNNYWETNFPVKQPGLNRFHYELETFETFDPQQALACGHRAARAVQLAAAVTCPAAEQGCLLELEGAGLTLLYVRPAKEPETLLVRLKSVSATGVQARLRFPKRTLGQAWLVDTLDQPLNELVVRADSLTVNAVAGALLNIRVKFRN
ncbi:MAG: hypothetical protein WCG80_09355 [Spirochaetales bacterium]